MWLNLIAFNLSWLLLVVFGNTFILLPLLWLMAHIYISPQRWAELKLICTVAVIGIAIDSLLQQLGAFEFANPNHIPLWLMTLWLCFAATLNHSLGFLARSHLLQIAVGALLPGLSYLAGARFGAVELGYSNLIIYLILGAIWAPLLVLCFWLRDRFAQEVTNVEC